MNHQEKIDRDVARDQAECFYYRGYTFPKYEGRLKSDEFKSGQHFFAFWGDTYLPQRAIMYHVDKMLETGRILEAA